MYTLKPFYLNLNDIAYLLDQVNFRPLFDAQGNGVINWDGSTAIYDAQGNLLSAGSADAATQAQLVQEFGRFDPLTGTYVAGFPEVSSPIGVRDVSGLHNNLFGTQSLWGNADVPFRRDVAANFDDYIATSGTAKVDIDPDTGALTVSYSDGSPSVTLTLADYAPAITLADGYKRITLNTGNPASPADDKVTFVADNGAAVTISLSAVAGYAAALSGHTIAANYGTTVGAHGTIFQSNVVDFMPRIISQTITTGGVNMLADGDGHFVEWNASRYATDSAYAAIIDSSGVAISQLVEGAKIVAPAGISVAWDPSGYDASTIYQTGLLLHAGIDGKLYGSDTGGDLVDGGPLYAFDGTTYNLITGGSGQPISFNAYLFIYHNLVDAATGGSTAGLTAGDAINVTGQDLADVTGALSGVGTVTTGLVQGLVTVDSGYGLLAQIGHIDFQNPDSGEYFVGSENPGVAPVNSWFGIFGQFFDHGLDFIDKGGQGTTISIALSPDDPLYRAPDPGTGDPGYTAIKIARATISGADGNGDPNYVNHTSPFIDQSQTYGSNDQVTSILREWVSTDGGGSFHAGIKLFDGTSLKDSWERRWPDGTTSDVHDTLPTLNELRQHVIGTGRDALTWEDVLNLRNRDLETGKLIDSDGDGTNGIQATGSGHALILDMNPHFDNAADIVDANGNYGRVSEADVQAAVRAVAGYETATVSLNFASGQLSSITIDNSAAGGGIETASLFALPGATSMGLVDPRSFSINVTTEGLQAAANEILMESVGDHYIAGDGRVNENFGLTSIHHVFHEEHNYQAENLKFWIYQHDANNPGATDAHEQLHQWQIDNHLAANNMDASGNYLNADGSISWDADKMFEATKLVVEMEYQHAAVDQYARTITPRIQEFVGYSTSVDATISLEYAQVAFRFGHSTIRETIDAIDPNGWFSGAVTRFALEKAFLAPQTFADEGVAAITLGLSRQQMNEVDEFVTPALNQGLLGQPLDLAAINIARGRDLGIPTLNEFRAAIDLAAYTSWADYANNMIHPESLVNFIAAYSFNGDVAKAQDIIGLAEGTLDVSAFGYTAEEAIAFLNNNDSGNAELDAARSGFDHIDAWIGGLAEAHVPGGLLGETFDAVFVAQIQALMDGDRFYYLYRLFGTNIHEEVNNGQFKDIVERNTGLSHLNGSIFAYADKYYDFNRGKDGTLTDTTGDHRHHLYSDLVNDPGNTMGIYSNGGLSTAKNGTVIKVGGVDYIRDVRANLHPDLVHPVEGTPTDGADSHEVIVATGFRDFIHARGGDDTVYGEDGNDIIFGDGGIDRLYGGNGDDRIDTGEGPDLADGGAGKDSIYGRGSGSEVGGFDQLVGGSGNDLIVGGEGIDKLSGGSGDDIIYGDGLTNPEMGNTDPFTHGGDGNDYIDGGASGDLLFGEEGDDYIVGGADQDLMQGGAGDDIIRPGNPSQASGTTGGPDEVIGDDGQANSGFDLIDFSDYAANAPGITVDFTTQNNPLVNIDQTTTFPAWFQIEGAIGTRNDDRFIGDNPGDATADNSLGGNWLIGGSGNDTFQGNGGNDVIIGGSVRLDTLIGEYAGADHGNLVLGSAAWRNDAMQSGGTGTGYDNNVEDSYTGASNRAEGDISGGLLEAAGFDRHFTEMLRSRMFKDVVLGDNGTDGTADTAVYTGALAEYTIDGFNAAGQIVATVAGGVPTYLVAGASFADIVAFRITDTMAGGRLAADGVTVVPSDGTDFLMGVDQLAFADQTISGEMLFDAAPAVDLNYVPTYVLDGFTSGNNAYGLNAGSVNWRGSWAETGDQTAFSFGQNATNTGAIQRVSPNNDGALQFQGYAGAGNDGAFITRGINLSAAVNPVLSFDLTKNNIDAAGETLAVQYSADGNTWATLRTYGSGASGTDPAAGHVTIDLSGQTLTANALLRFAVSALGSTEFFRVDNVRVDISPADANGSRNNTVDYTEQLAPAAISVAPLVTDADDTTLASATVHLRDGAAGDILTIADVSALGLTATGSGTDTITLTGAVSPASYQQALSQILFSNPTNDNPGSANRHVDVTVNDGLKDSDVATTTVRFHTVNDAATLVSDSVITNFGTVSFSVPDWALLVNDSDPDSSLSISGVNSSSGLTGVSHASGGGGSVTITDNLTPGGSFRYYGSGVALNDGARPTVTVTQQNGANASLEGTAGAEIIVDNNSAHVINGNGGNDIIFGNGGDDVINGNAGADIIRGGLGIDTLYGGGGSDTFVFGSLGEASAGGIADTIVNFKNSSNAVHDVIDVSLIDARAGGGDQAFAFSTTGAANYSIWITTDGNDIIINGDNNGNASSIEFQIRLHYNPAVVPLPTLTAADFVL